MKKVSRWPKRLLGLLEIIAVSMAVYAMVVSTPLGGWMYYGLKRLLGYRARTPALATYFSTEGQSAPGRISLEMITTAPEAASETSQLASSLGLRPTVARAVLFVASNMKADDSGALEVRVPELARSSLESVGVTVPPDSAASEAHERALIEGTAKLATRLGNEHAAVTALSVDVVHVQYALERAVAAGAKAPIRYDSFRSYLSPDLRAEADPFANSVFALVVAYEMRSPVDGRPRVTSPFGYRHHPVLKKKKFHTGIDLAIPTGTQLFAVAAGTVVYATEDSVNGKFVKIDHGHGVTSAYCHASELKVKKGEEVDRGALIALSGESGRATGPHLHFQIGLDDKPVDPELFLKNAFQAVASKGFEVDRHGRRFAAAQLDARRERGGHREAEVVLESKTHAEGAFVDQVSVLGASVGAGRGDGRGHGRFRVRRHEQHFDLLPADHVARVDRRGAVDRPKSHET